MICLHYITSASQAHLMQYSSTDVSLIFRKMMLGEKESVENYPNTVVFYWEGGFKNKKKKNE